MSRSIGTTIDRGPWRYIPQRASNKRRSGNRIVSCIFRWIPSVSKLSDDRVGQRIMLTTFVWPAGAQEDPASKATLWCVAIQGVAGMHEFGGP
jgi:hypothetical protein